VSVSELVPAWDGSWESAWASGWVSRSELAPPWVSDSTDSGGRVPGVLDGKDLGGRVPGIHRIGVFSPPPCYFGLSTTRRRRLDLVPSGK